MFLGLGKLVVRVVRQTVLVSTRRKNSRRTHVTSLVLWHLVFKLHSTGAETVEFLVVFEEQLVPALLAIARLDMFEFISEDGETNGGISQPYC